MNILDSLAGVVLHPLGPPKFGGDGSYGCQILPTSPIHDTVQKADLSLKSMSQMVDF